MIKDLGKGNMLVVNIYSAGSCTDDEVDSAIVINEFRHNDFLPSVGRSICALRLLGENEWRRSPDRPVTRLCLFYTYLDSSYQYLGGFANMENIYTS